MVEQFVIEFAASLIGDILNYSGKTQFHLVLNLNSYSQKKNTKSLGAGINHTYSTSLEKFAAVCYLKGR